jgi:stage II sporulation protein P
MELKYIKAKDHLIKKIRNAFFVIALSIIAVTIGITGGNVLSESKLNIIKRIDVEVFKIPLNKSFPLIDTIYNSGNMNSSFFSEFKNLLGDIFDFDLNNPLTILNSQSPLFSNYFVNIYKQKELAKINEMNHDDSKTVPEDTIIPNTDKPPEQIPNDNQFKQGVASSISTDEGSEERDYSPKNLISDGKIAIHNETKFKINIEQLLQEPLQFKFDRKGPKALIYHTHTSESYVEGRYSDGRFGVVKVGEELAKNLRKKNGFEVIHNAVINDYNYDNSYVNAFSTVTKILKGNPSVRMVFDVHRDGLKPKDPKLRVVKKVNGKNAAQIMFVVGTNSTGLSHPNWRENLKLAMKLQEKLNSISPGLARHIYISKNRYNEHVKLGALIVEIGGDGNSTAECLESTKYLAEAVKLVAAEIK